eukprot:COSAG05_NODE_2447_length_3056_cov_1.630707_2_plen_97_part_00
MVISDRLIVHAPVQRYGTIAGPNPRLWCVAASGIFNVNEEKHCQVVVAPYRGITGRFASRMSVVGVELFFTKLSQIVSFSSADYDNASIHANVSQL